LASGKETPLSVGTGIALATTIYGGTSEIMKTIIAREVTGLRT
jgi:alkylation response protein AidB-like acyl-CoA dehydrogenase